MSSPLRQCARLLDREPDRTDVFRELGTYRAAKRVAKVMLIDGGEITILSEIVPTLRHMPHASVERDQFTC